MDTLKVYKRAREILTPEASWGKGSYAKSGDRSVGLTIWDRKRDVEVLNPEATCFCALGAIRAAGMELYSEDGVFGFAFHALECVPEQYRDSGYQADVVSFNDAAETTHAQVLAMFDCVIGKMEQADMGAEPNSSTILASEPSE